MNSSPPINPSAVGTLLETIAKNRDVINYGRIVEQFGLPPLDGAWAAHPLSNIFEVLDQQDAAANRPFRTSVVVAAETNRPGNGYFEALHRLKNIPDPRTAVARDALWSGELQAAYNHQWP